MGCNQSSDADVAAADPFRERRNRLRDSRKRGGGPSGPSPAARRADAAATTDAVDQAIRANRTAFPSSRDIPGFVNPLAGITPEGLAAAMSEANPSVGVTMTAGNTSTIATNAATLGGELGDDGSFYPTDAITDYDDEPKPAPVAVKADFNVVSGDSIGRLADVPEDDTAAAQHRRHGMDEHAHPSLDTTNTNLPRQRTGAHDKPNRVVAGSSRSQHTAVAAAPDGGLTLPAAHCANDDDFQPQASAVVDQPTTVTSHDGTAHPATAEATNGDAVFHGSPDAGYVLTVATLTMHRRRLRALVAASTVSFDHCDAAADPMAEWLDEVITVTIRAPHLRVKIVEESF